MNILDQRITAFVGKLADASPPAIEFEHLGSPRVATAPAVDRRPLMAIAAALLVVVGLVAITQVARPGDGTASLPIEPSLAAITGMPFAVVPTELPTGWRIVDLFDSGASEPAEPASSFLFRSPTTGAAIYIQTWPMLDPDAGPFGDLRESFDASGAATFAVDGSFVWMRIAGIGTDQAVALAESLVLDDVGPDRVPRLPTDSGFELETNRSIAEVSATNGSVAALRLRTPNGTVDITLDARDPANTAWNHYGVATAIGDTVVYVSPYSVTGEPIDGRITAAVQVSNPADIDAAAALFMSLERAPLSAWDDIEDQIAADISAVPVVDRLEIRDFTVTRHHDGSTTAICATRRDTTRCRSSESPIWGRDPTESVNVVVDGLWIIAGSIAADDLTEFSVSPAEAVVGEHRPSGGRVFFAYAVLSANQVQIDYDSDAISGQFGFDRQAR